MIKIEDIKKGLNMIAIWDGALCKITDIKKDIVYYKSITYPGNYKDKINVVSECFNLTSDSE